MVRSNPVICILSNSVASAAGLRRVWLGVGLVCVASMQVLFAADAEAVLRVCADPSNLPLSNQSGEGYENKIAEQLARDLGRSVEYTFFPQRMGFVRNTLRLKDAQTQQFKCDVIIGVPKGYELTATTKPYMRSTYALVFPWRKELADVETAADLLKLPRQVLDSLRVGVFGRTPGADWLLKNEMIEHAVFYSPQSGDPNESPAHIIEQDLLAGKIDMAIVWGPMAGYLVRRHASYPTWLASPFLPQRDIKFDYEISMGVRFGEKEWQQTLDTWIGKHQAQVDEILLSYRVPLLDAEGKAVPPQGDSERQDSVRKQIPLQLGQD